MTKRSFRKMFDEGRYDEIYEGLMNGSIEDKWNIVEKSNGDYDEMFEVVIPSVLGYETTKVQSKAKPKVKKVSKPKKFDRKSLREYFRMVADGRCGMYRGHVYLEVRSIRGKEHYILYREIKGSTDPTSEYSWKVIYEGNDVETVCKHLFAYSDYETYNWNVPYNYEGFWSNLNEVVAGYRF